ncbi:hypothetical protein EV363DRAFT_1225087 [Boletus edulis]|uniref:RBR-type E3 ubiquitin transferase n=1 Tax=Boletus edulis BED1 TaxID=1328754 RepID=A0AAD4GJ61_BOLED|nr:hypothetical protein EV363DRAFT_1225087 [Boletus edulis]KAF8447280.1 hypothetical protein L210DRAFT_2787718 [Boletus edulis BED1]
MGFVLTKLASPVRWFLNVPCNEGPKKEDPRAQYLQRLSVLEKGERDDYEAALALQRGEDLPPQTEAQLEMSKVSFAELLEKFLVANTVAERPYSEPEPSGSSGFFTRSIWFRKQFSKTECVVCRDGYENVASLNAPCGHFICRQCVIGMAEVANKNEDLFPLQCCQQQLPVDTFLSFLSGPLLVSFSAKCAEAATPPNLRVYCANKTCAKFIGRSLTATPCVMSCPDCRTKVCSGCKSRAHPRQSCDEREYSEVQALAKANGWKTCPKCKMIVERSAGCAHMTCRCRQGFCYKCGAKWGRCICSGYY